MRVEIDGHAGSDDEGDGRGERSAGVVGSVVSREDVQRHEDDRDEHDIERHLFGNAQRSLPARLFGAMTCFSARLAR